MRLISEKGFDDVNVKVYETNGYKLTIHTIAGVPPVMTVACVAEGNILYKPKIICSPSGISVSCEGISFCYDEDSRAFNEMIEAVHVANVAAGEIYLLLKKLNFIS